MEFGTMLCRQVIYTVLDMGCFLLWDEPYKKYFIDIMAEVKSRLGIEVYAFTVLSGKVYMLSGRFGEYSEEEAWDFQNEILKHYLALKEVPSSETDELMKDHEISMTICPIRKHEDIMKTIIYIHLVAMNEGYVRFGIDYWWSSAQTYRSRYIWRAVDTDVVLGSLSPNREHARRVLVRRHHGRESAGNPAPSCLSASFTVKSRDAIPDAVASRDREEESQALTQKEQELEAEAEKQKEKFTRRQLMKAM